MKKLEVERIAEYGHALGATMVQEYGGLYAPPLHSSGAGLNHESVSGVLRRGRLPGMSQEINLIKPQDPHNLAVLTSPGVVGRAFGLMTKHSFQSGQRLVRAAVITSRTHPGALHVLPLLESGTPLDQFRGIDALGRMMVEIGGLIQQPGIGTAEADVTRGTPAELGHALQGISALTDTNTLEAIQRKRHVAHDWNGDGYAQNRPVVAPGPAVALTARENQVSLFTVQTDQGVIQNGFLPEVVITDTVQEYIFVDYTGIVEGPQSAQLGISAAELAVGMGLEAASSQLEQGGATLQARAMGIMRAI